MVGENENKAKDKGGDETRKIVEREDEKEDKER